MEPSTAKPNIEILNLKKLKLLNGIIFALQNIKTFALFFSIFNFVKLADLEYYGI